jgi:hypothetical protein
MTSIYIRVANPLAYGAGLFALALFRKCLNLPDIKHKNVALNFSGGRGAQQPPVSQGLIHEVSRSDATTHHSQ